ncbi:MAG: hypothetical protein WA735_08670 [Candidatus Acidiferrales bacterium]
MPEPSALPWKVAAEKAAGELDIEKLRHHVRAAETAIFSGFRSCQSLWTRLKNLRK